LDPTPPERELASEPEDVDYIFLRMLDPSRTFVAPVLVVVGTSKGREPSAWPRRAARSARKRACRSRAARLMGFCSAMWTLYRRF